MKIPVQEVAFHPLSIADPSGRVFRWDGQLLRGVSAQRAALYRDLLNRGLFDHWAAAGLLIPTEATDYELEGYAFVLRHRALPVVTYAAEWPAAMLKAAGETILNLQAELLKHGLMLQDGHPFNVLFDGVKPWFVDVGSIVPAAASGQWHAYDEFCRFVIHPLQVMAAGHCRVARWLLHDHSRGVQASEAAALCGEPSPSSLEQPVSAAAAVEAARERLAAIPISGPSTEWSNYFDAPGSFPDFTPGPTWNAKQHSVHQFLQEARPATLLDIGCNRGWFSQVAARGGARVIAADLDEPALNLLYADTSNNGLAIHPISMDFSNPLPGYGIHNAWFEPALNRLRCEAVLALAVVHHLVRNQYLRFEHIADGLAALTGRWLVVEFIAREDEHVARWKNMPAWYDLDNFETQLRHHFRTLRRLPSDLEHRVILVCER